MKLSRSFFHVGLLLCCSASVLVPQLSRAEYILGSFGTADEVRRFDSITGADLGVFASGIATPSGIAWDGNNKLAYVANFDSNEVRQYSATGTLMNTFATGLSGPDEMAVDALGNYYVANYLGFNVKKFNPVGTLLATFNTGGGRPEGMGFASNGDLLVNIYTGTGGGTIRRYNSSTGAFINTFASGMTNPLGMTQDAAGNVYVANFTAGTVFKYSPAGALVDSVTLGYLGYDLAFNELGELLVTNANPGNAINRYDQNLNFIGNFASPAASPTYIAFIPEPSHTLLLMLSLGTLLVRAKGPSL